MSPVRGGTGSREVSHPSSGWTAVWTTAAFLAVLLAPASLWLGQRFWTLAPADQIQSWTWGAAFLLWTQFTRSPTPAPPWRATAQALLWGSGCFVTGAVVLHLLGAPWSRVVAGGSFVLGAMLIAGPLWFPRVVRAGAIPLALGTASSLALVGADPPVDPPHDLRVVTSLHVLKGAVHTGVTLPGRTWGGALVRAGDVVLVTNADGAFAAVRRVPDADSITVVRLALDVPMGRAAFDAEGVASKGELFLLRVTDLAIDSVGATPRLLVAHQVWHAEPGCFSLSVSGTPLAPVLAGTAGGGEWTTLFDTAPCLPLTPGLRTTEAGGSLEVLADGGILVTVGDHGLNGPGEPLIAQDAAADYGKTLLLQGNRATPFTLGHRNPQGLFVTHDGALWSTEHGPRGGDELNLLVRGANYGWPLVTYGTEYGQTQWRLSAPDGDHGAFVEPVQAFVPSPGPSDLIEVSSPRFPRWAGDLLIATMPAKGLLRVRVRDGRAVVVEPIELGHRIRDLTQGASGELLLLTDEGSLIVVEPDPIESLGEDVYQSCATCHGAGLEGTSEGPPLIGIVGRRIASQPGFDYSPALRAMDQLWSPESLQAFLAAPHPFAPGATTTMAGLDDAERRQAVIDYLSLFD